MKHILQLTTTAADSQGFNQVYARTYLGWPTRIREAPSPALQNYTEEMENVRVRFQGKYRPSWNLDKLVQNVSSTAIDQEFIWRMKAIEMTKGVIIIVRQHPRSGNELGRQYILHRYPQIYWREYNTYWSTYRDDVSNYIMFCFTQRPTKCSFSTFCVFYLAIQCIGRPIHFAKINNAI